jgi:glycosyltransferase involved in cell wall biosynthesis
MKPTVVLFQIRDPTTRVSGGERYVCAHARAAVRAGLESHVFCVHRQAGVEETDIGTVHRVWSPVRPFRNIMAPLHAPFLGRGIRRFLAGRRGPHILHGFTTATGTALAVAGSSEGQRAGCVPVGTVWDGLYEESIAKLRGVDPTQGLRGRINPALEVAWNAAFMRGYEGRTYRRCPAVFVNYESIRRLLVSRYGVNSSRIHLLPYAPETAFLPTSNLAMPDTIAELRSAGVPLIVVISRHVPRKGLPVLFKALAALLARGCGFRACFVGGGYLLEHHRQMVKDLGLSEVVRMVGHVPESFAYVRHADVFVLPSLEEGSGSMSMVEAMQAGAAIIATRIDGIPEDVTDGDNALLVGSDNVPELAAAVRRLLEDAALRRRLGEKGHEIFLRRFSADALTTGLVNAYARLLEAPR